MIRKATEHDIDAVEQGYTELLTHEKENVIEVKIAIPGGEDFSEFTKRVPCVYYYHGGNFGDERDFPQHSSKFDLNEQTLWSGVAVMTQFALDWQDM